MDHIGGLATRAVLAWGLVTFAARPLSAPPPEFLSDRHHLGGRLLADHAGHPHRAEGRDAEAAGGEGRATAKPVENPTAKVVDKPEIVPTADQVQPQARAGEEGRAEAADAAAAAQARAEAGLRQGAGAEDRSDRRGAEEGQTKPEKKQERRPRRRRRRRRPSRRSRSRSSTRRRIAALLDKRDAQRRAATGEHARATRPRSAPRPARAVTLSQNELDALRARLRQCWNVPVGLAEARDLVVTVRIQFKQDGSLLGRAAA